ncbi:uncharacterized protein LOC110024439 [Phalaenopsis equestris]|uniref:uncharacterized protein LOC110024439 n=1 Tax=Phalaenopsis equestris TaxID=78828 RepID=UPI0009E43612|nr:uncharacterized protein LOC110024439 [Phalaenopsis equestris]XP_020580065.1 uncharacterized protein LOC110024439 [Phalaenopsis equestris]XP_020580066.1 uncharacterized protein LOC110024439 [Phalaenopsis equestris]
MAGMGDGVSDPRLHLPGSDRQKQKRLVFDRRYGWVFDEWKDPAEEALAGGRGMFCVVPIAKCLLRMASQSINCAVESVAKVRESSGQIPPPALHAVLINKYQKVKDLSKSSTIT